MPPHLILLSLIMLVSELCIFILVVCDRVRISSSIDINSIGFNYGILVPYTNRSCAEDLLLGRGLRFSPQHVFPFLTSFLHEGHRIQ